MIKALALSLALATGCATAPRRDPVAPAAGHAVTWTGVAGLVGSVVGMTYVGIEGDPATVPAVGLGFSVALMIAGTIILDAAAEDARE